MPTNHSEKPVHNGVVLILNGDPAHSDAVRAWAERAGFATRQFDSLDQLQKQWDWSQPSCLVTDLRKFGSKGRLSKQLAQESGSMPIIVLSGHHVPDAAVAVENSSFRWLSRPPAENDIAQAIRQALERDRDHFQRLARATETRRKLKTLTPVERRVLDQMMAGKRNKSIAFALDMGVRTVELKRQHIFQKLEADSLAELVLMVAEAKSVGEYDEN